MTVSRRDFLKLAREGLLWLSGALTLGGVLRFLAFEAHPAHPTEISLGPATRYPLHSRTVLEDIPTVLLHTESGFTARSLTCTHLGCTLGQKAEGFTCPCHGSEFGDDGGVRRGPAEHPLPSLRVEQTPEGNLILYTV